MSTWSQAVGGQQRGAGWRRALWPCAIAVGAVAACALLYAVPPGEGGLYPPCPFHAATGLHCPGCGTLRALHALLHGDPAAAVGLNILTVLSLPFLACALLSRASPALRGRPLPWPRVSAVWAWLLVGVVFAFWLLRNVPIWPCSLLAP